MFFFQNGSIDKNESRIAIQENVKKRELEDIAIKNIILDCSCINHIDSQGVQAVEWLYDNYKEIDIQLNFTNCKSKAFS